MQAEDSDGDDGMDLDDFKVTAKPTARAYEIEYNSLTQSAIEKLMEEDVEHIRGIFGVDASAARLLLRHLSWNKERLIEKYMDNANKMLVSAGVAVPEPEPPAPKSPSGAETQIATQTTFVCSICFDDGPELTTRSRWTATTPHARAAVDEETYTRFEELLVRHFVSCAPHLKFCPYPSCTNTVSCPSAASKSSLTTVVPTVSCGARGLGPPSGSMTQSQELVKQATGKEHKFCFGCIIDSDHRPVVCGIALLWLKKCRDDSETANWIKSNTKECPKCMSTIEKNGGCKYVLNPVPHPLPGAHSGCVQSYDVQEVQTRVLLGVHGPWVDHGTAWYSCNRYDEKGGVDARDSQSKSRASLERYLHVLLQPMGEPRAERELALDLFAKTEKKMEEMQVTSTLTWIEVQFMKKAVEELDKCRMTLKWTYAMAYYLAKGNQKDLFEDNQRDLERAVEDLAELLESPIEPENIPTLRQKVTDKTVYVQKRNEIVLEDTSGRLPRGAVGVEECVRRWV
ncbi:hypothetical protein B0H14DRAFT_3506873 [Mycena olivaceomarginata]|nr:hypothetical protein B0H14DRAFT_3506873 [Mycena olivaceomarginata]